MDGSRSRVEALKLPKPGLLVFEIVEQSSGRWARLRRRLTPDQVHGKTLRVVYHNHVAASRGVVKILYFARSGEMRSSVDVASSVTP